MLEPQKPQSVSPPVRPVIRLDYTCPARPPEYVDMKALNTFGRDNDGFYWESSGKKYHSEIDFIRMLFTPRGMSWSDAINAVK